MHFAQLSYINIVRYSFIVNQKFWVYLILFWVCAGIGRFWIFWDKNEEIESNFRRDKVTTTLFLNYIKKKNVERFYGIVNQIQDSKKSFQRHIICAISMNGEEVRAIFKIVAHNSFIKRVGYTFVSLRTWVFWVDLIRPQDCFWH